MKVVVFGGSGFIGGCLKKKLEEKGHVVELSDVRKDSSYATKIQNSDAVINLGGHSLFKNRWTVEVMAKIQDSRVESTRQIVDAIGRAKEQGMGPQTLINGSAIGYYGAGPMTLVFNEESPLGPDFLARVCDAWEEEAFKAQGAHGVRTVAIRTGVVLGKEGGALKQLLPVFKLGQGSLLGNGEQPFAWIHLEDIAGIFVHALENDSVNGPLNAVAPQVLTNRQFSMELKEVLDRPELGLMGPLAFQQAFGQFVKMMLYVFIGEAASIIANGQNVSSKKAQESGYVFKFPQLKEALKNIILIK